MNKVVSFFLGLLLAGVAQAQTCTKWLYVGAPFRTVTESGNPALGSSTFPSTITGPLTGTITLTTPLAPNLSNAAIVTNYAFPFTLGPVAAWEFSLTYPALVSINPPTISNNMALTVSTDVDGNITAWAMFFRSGEFVSAQDQLDSGASSSNATGDEVSVSLLGNGGDIYTISGTSTKPGTWTCLQAFSAAYTAPPPPPPPPDPLASLVKKLYAQLAAVTFERDEYVAMVRALNAAIAVLEKKK